MEFALSEEHQMLKDLALRFVKDELIPLEPVQFEREDFGQGTTLDA